MLLRGLRFTYVAEFSARWLMITHGALMLYDQTVADIIIAVSMCTLLWRRRTGFQRSAILSALFISATLHYSPFVLRTDTAIKHLIVFAIHSGVVTRYLRVAFQELKLTPLCSISVLAMTVLFTVGAHSQHALPSNGS